MLQLLKSALNMGLLCQPTDTRKGMFFHLLSYSSYNHQLRSKWKQIKFTFNETCNMKHVSNLET